MAKALYRKYRPRSLAEVVGQEQVTDVLQNSLRRGRASHAYLFVGPRGTGKTSVARIFAHEINGFEYELEDDYVDIVEIDGASNRGIDDIRELREKAAIAPSQGKFKVYIIDEVHMLTREAFNALLKTLEEPPAHVVFVMATTDVQKVPNTIISRAQSYTFRLADAATMQKFLRGVAEKEGIKISDDALAVVTERGGGSFRDSLSLLDQIATLSDAEITRELVVAALGLPEKERVGEILAAYEAGDLGRITDVLREMMASGVKAEVVAEELVARIVAEPKPVWLPLLAALTGVAAPFVEAKLLVALVGNVENQHVQIFSRTGEALASESRAGKPGGFSGGPIPGPASAGNVLEKTERIDSQTSEHGAGRARDPSQPGNVPEKNEKIAPKASRSHSAEPRSENVESRAVESKSESVATPQESTVDFDHTQFVAKIRDLSEAIYSQLKNTTYAVRGNGLQIYPQKKIAQRILGAARNLEVLRNAAAPLSVTIHEFGEQPAGPVHSWADGAVQTAKNDPIAAKISGIMGGEVVQDGGDSPF